MGLHVYCIVPPGHAPSAGLRGVDDAPVRVVDIDGLGVWASTHEQPPAAGLDSMRRHNEVVSAGMSDVVTPVPIRFGQWFAADAAMRERIAGDGPHWAALIERFAGRAEYGATFVLPEGEAARDVRPAAVPTGTAYMQQLAQRQADAASRRRLAEHIADDIAARLSDFDVETNLETPPGGPVVARLSHLVAWEDADAYHAVMREVRGSRQDVRVHLTGPWPPWSFTR